MPLIAGNGGVTPIVVTPEEIIIGEGEESVIVSIEDVVVIIEDDISDFDFDESDYVYPDYSDIPHEMPYGYYPIIPHEDDNVLEDVPQTESMGMSDNQIRRYLIDNVWVKHDMPIMAWDQFILSANWMTFGNKLAFLETLKAEMKYLARLPNGTTHTAEYDRVKGLAKNVDLIEEEYEESPQFWIERFKDKIKGLTLAVQITIGISIAVGVVFGLFVLYNYLKSYGTEMGIKQARD